MQQFLENKSNENVVVHFYSPDGLIRV